MWDSANKFHQPYVKFARIAGVVATAAGMLVLVGWWLDLDVLKSLAPTLASMKANTALGFVLGGISLWLQCPDPTRSTDKSMTRLRVASIVGAVVAALGALTLIEYLASVNLGFDQVLFTEIETSSKFPGRMSPATAANFMLLGVALVQCHRTVSTRLCEWCTLFVLVSALIAAVGYLYGVQALYRVGPYASMALHTTVLFVLLAAGVMASRPAQGWMKTFTSDLAGGASARRVIPWVLLTPLALGSLWLWGEREELYGAEFGLVLFTISNVLVLVTVVYRNARILNASDLANRQQLAREQRTDQQLRIIDERWRLAAMSGGLGAWNWSPASHVLEWSDRRYALFGTEEASVTLENFLVCVHPDDRARVNEALHRAYQDHGPYECEYRITLPDGNERWIASWARTTYDEPKGADRMYGVVLDITEKKRVEELLLNQNRVLHLVAAGMPLHDILNELLKLVEGQSPGLLTSILLLDETGTTLRHGAAPSLSEEYCNAIEGIVIGPQAGSCGTAAYRREPVIVADIQADPLWVNYRDLAARVGLRASWSTPIIGANGRLLGTFAMYYRVPGRPEPAHAKAISFVTQTAILAIEHQQAQDAIRASEARYRTLGDNSPDVIARYDRELRYVYVNRAIEAATGIAPERFRGKTFAELGMPAAQIELWSATLRQVFENGQSQRVTFDFPGPGGTRYWEGIAVAERNARNEIESALVIARDITQRKFSEAEHDKLEAQLRQSHKLQALGTLAGGIAHDFNNMLMIINGNATLAHTKVTTGHPVHNHLREIEKAGARAADLVRRILAFSRPQDSQRKPVRLQPIIEETLQLLRSTIPATIQIQTRFAPDSTIVMADATQLHQVFMNLGVNAAHAMRERGGTLEVLLEVVAVDAALARTSPALHAGIYERVTITDTGSGMDAATLERIFDPFYTTKSVGEGTGLGLSVVHGIMLGHGGAITVTSRPLEGASFSLYFPVAESAPHDPPVPVPLAVAAGRRERILFVDDEEALVLLVTRILEQLNYHVTSATDPQVALAKFMLRPQDFDVLVTDLAMPGMSGFDLARAVLKIRPKLPIIVTTGYIRPEDADTARSLGIEHLITKPNTVTELGVRLKQLFEARGAGSQDQSA